MVNHCLQALLFVVLSIQVTYGKRITEKKHELEKVTFDDSQKSSAFSMEYSLTESKCDCGLSKEGVNLNPVCSTGGTNSSGRCSSRDLARAKCEQNQAEAAKQLDGKAMVVYAARKKQCSATGYLWCCKTMETSQADSYFRMTRENLNIFKDWILEVQTHVDEAVLQLQLKVEEGNTSGRTSDANIKAAEILVSQCKGLASNFSDSMEQCAVRGKDDIESGCAQYRTWTIASRNYANKLLAIIARLSGLVNYMLYGSELTRRMDYLKTGWRELWSGGVTRKMGVVARKVFQGLWNRRMKILIGFSIAAYAVPLANILTTTVTLTTVSQGYDVVFSTLIRTVFWRLICPAIYNPLLMGFVVQWVVTHIILSDMFLSFVDLAILPATGLVESLRWLQSKVRGMDYKSMTRSFAAHLKGLHKRHGMVSWAIWTMLWTLVSHVWNILGRLVCTAGAHVTDSLTLVENGAEAATRHASKGVWGITSWMSRNAKALLGGSTSVQTDAETLLSNMQMLEQQMPSVSTYLGLSVKGLQKLHAVYVPANQMASSALTGLLDHLSLKSAFGAITAKWVTGRIAEYMKGRERSVNVDELIKVIEAEESVLAGMQGYSNITNAACDMYCQLNKARLEGADTAARLAMAKVKGVPLSDISRMDMPSIGAIESPHFRNLAAYSLEHKT